MRSVTTVTVAYLVFLGGRGGSRGGRGGFRNTFKSGDITFIITDPPQQKSSINAVNQFWVVALKEEHKHMLKQLL